MAEDNDKTTTILGIMFFICIFVWISEHSSYTRLEKEYSDYRDFVHATVDHIPYISNKIIDYELYIEEVKELEAENRENNRYMR